MINRKLILFFISALTHVISAAQNVLPPMAEKPEVIFFECNHPLMANPSKIPEIVALKPFFEHVTQTLQQSIIVNFVDVPPTRERAAFTSPQNSPYGKAMLWILKEDMLNCSALMIENNCALAIAQALYPQQIARFGQHVCVAANHTAKMIFLYQAYQLIWQSFQNSSFTPIDKSGSNILHWMGGTGASWISIKATHTLINKMQENNLRKKALPFVHNAELKSAYEALVYGPKATTPANK